MTASLSMRLAVPMIASLLLMMTVTPAGRAAVAGATSLTNDTRSESTSSSPSATDKTATVSGTRIRSSTTTHTLSIGDGSATRTTTDSSSGAPFTLTVEDTRSESLATVSLTASYSSPTNAALRVSPATILQSTLRYRPGSQTRNAANASDGEDELPSHTPAAANFVAEPSRLLDVVLEGTFLDANATRDTAYFVRSFVTISVDKNVDGGFHSRIPDLISSATASLAFRFFGNDSTRFQLQLPLWSDFYSPWDEVVAIRVDPRGTTTKRLDPLLLRAQFTVVAEPKYRVSDTVVTSALICSTIGSVAGALLSSSPPSIASYGPRVVSLFRLNECYWPRPTTALDERRAYLLRWPTSVGDIAESHAYFRAQQVWNALSTSADDTLRVAPAIMNTAGLVAFLVVHLLVAVVVRLLANRRRRRQDGKQKTARPIGANETVKPLLLSFEAKPAAARNRGDEVATSKTPFSRLADEIDQLVGMKSSSETVSERELMAWLEAFGAVRFPGLLIGPLSLLMHDTVTSAFSSVLLGSGVVQAIGVIIILIFVLTWMLIAGHLSRRFAASFVSAGEIHAAFAELSHFREKEREEMALLRSDKLLLLEASPPAVVVRKVLPKTWSAVRVLLCGGSGFWRDTKARSYYVQRLGRCFEGTRDGASKFAIAEAAVNIGLGFTLAVEPQHGDCNTLHIVATGLFAGHLVALIVWRPFRSVALILAHVACSSSMLSSALGGVLDAYFITDSKSRVAAQAAVTAAFLVASTAFMEVALVPGLRRMLGANSLASAEERLIAAHEIAVVAQVKPAALDGVSSPLLLPPELLALVPPPKLPRPQPDDFIAEAHQGDGFVDDCYFKRTDADLRRHNRGMRLILGSHRGRHRNQSTRLNDNDADSDDAKTTSEFSRSPASSDAATATEVARRSSSSRVSHVRPSHRYKRRKKMPFGSYWDAIDDPIVATSVPGGDLVPVCRNLLVENAPKALPRAHLQRETRQSGYKSWDADLKAALATKRERAARERDMLDVL